MGGGDRVNCRDSMGLAMRLGVLHALVDAACVAVLYSEVALDRLPYETLTALVLLYNSLAFGLQWLLGIVADLAGAYRLTAAGGTWLIAAAVITEPIYPWAGAVLAGIGNACFHVGAGAVVLRQSRGRAAECGIFVGPGAMGLATGLWLGLNSGLWRLPAIVLLLCSNLMLLREVLMDSAPAPAPLRSPPSHEFSPSPCPAPRPPGKHPEVSRLLTVPIMLLLGSVAIRSGVGGLLSGSWRTSAFAAFSLAAAAMTGKCIGGLVSDRLGWRVSNTLALLVAAPLVAAGLQWFDAALPGMLVFQFTMPVTLAAVYLALPRWPGFAFGLPCLALLIGALPELAALIDPAVFNPFAAPLILLSALLLFAGLKKAIWNYELRMKNVGLRDWFLYVHRAFRLRN